MADQARIQYLFDKYIGKKCTSAEVEELVSLLQDKEAEEMLTPRLYALWEQIKVEQKINLPPGDSSDADWQQMYKHLGLDSDYPVIKHSVRKRIIFRAAAAVAAILILSGGWYMWQRSTAGNKIAMQEQMHDVPPGGNKAVLTLANGATIILDQAANGKLAKQGQTQIIKLDSGALAYQPAGNNASQTAVQYNMLATPRGGQYQIRLPDGTKVWLNAASSIRYPTAFTGKERRVEITGEAYFEVAQNASRPFIVTVNNMQVNVLGTNFNINAYQDEGVIKTTLLEGSVKVQAALGNAIVLIPGQQTQLNKDGKITLVEKVDVGETVAWKNGLFIFHNDELASIMRQLSRWYDVEVEYKNNKVPVSHFTGAIRRQENISKVFKMLELTGGAHFEINGRKIIVAP